MRNSRLVRILLAAVLAVAAAAGVTGSVVHGAATSVVADPERCC